MPEPRPRQPPPGGPRTRPSAGGGVTNHPSAAAATESELAGPGDPFLEVGERLLLRADDWFVARRRRHPDG